jgi:hypothetical protein
LKDAPAPPRIYGQRLELDEGTSPRGLPCHCTDKAGSIYSTPQYICRVALFLLHVCLQQGRRRPTPKFCAAGEGGVTTAETCVSAAAKLRPTTRARRSYIGLGTAIKYLRRTTSGAAGKSLGDTIKYLRRATSGAAGNGLGPYRGLLMCPFTKIAPHSPCFFFRSSFANKQNSTAEVRG